MKKTILTIYKICYERSFHEKPRLQHILDIVDIVIFFVIGTSFHFYLSLVTQFKMLRKNLSACGPTFTFVSTVTFVT